MGKKGSKQLYNKLLFLYTGVVVCVVLALMLYFLNGTRARYVERNREYMQMLHSEAESYVNDSREIADYLHEELYNSNMEINDLLHYLSDSPEAYQQYRLDTYAQYKLLEYKGIEDFSAAAFEAYPSIKRVTFVSYVKSEVTTFDGSQSYHVDNAERVLQQIRDEDTADFGEFSFLKDIRDPLTMQNVGVMIVTFNGDRFEKIRDNYSLPELIVISKKGVVVYNSYYGQDTEGLAKAENMEQLESLLDAYALNSNMEDYSVITFLKKDTAAQMPFSVFLMIGSVGAVVLGISEILIRYYLNRLSVRLNRILDGMSKVMSGDLTVRLAEGKKGDELDFIAGHFNEMCEKLDMHIQKSYTAEIEQKNAEMAALQSQINPHFLYNTLEAIRMKAICNGDLEVGKMIYSMAVTFRSQLKEADVITLASELHYCKKYLELFEYRYPKQFCSKVECPLEYMQVPIIKFVLQPLIENYFIHGIRMGADDNFMRIYVEKKGGDYEIIVEDNGRGMTDEEIHQENIALIENKIEKNKAIGLSNVNRRVKAVYGSDYGIRIEKADTGGLRVILKFKSKEEDDNEESDDC